MMILLLSLYSQVLDIFFYYRKQQYVGKSQTKSSPDPTIQKHTGKPLVNFGLSWGYSCFHY